MSAIVAIPARLESTRFPRKVLADLHGRPMLWHVYQGVSQSQKIGEVWVMTDSTEVYEAAASWGAKVVMTSSDCFSGTDRIASVADSLNADIIVNVQGDEPLITGHVVDAVVSALESSDAGVATPVYRITSLEEITNPNVVKVVRGADDRVLLFSRSPIPHVRDTDPELWLDAAEFWGHVGVYAYRRSTLLQFPHLPVGRLEGIEKLEQLRLLEAGTQFLAVEIDYRPHAVDSPSDLERVKQILEKGGTA